ncbi:FAD-binding Berberine family protein [Forsythia ovata]|uniref:FAD-binding Berberine family protein n=1 Tax=Forsythia ovata TaxID=205694 RepID=A0ABD1WPZ3_9LAMI
MTLDVVNSSFQTGEKTNRETFLTLFLGDSEKLHSLMNETFRNLGLKQSDCTEMCWVEYVLFWTNFPAGTPVNILLSRVPQVLTHLKRKSDYLKNPILKQGLEFIFKRMIELKSVMLTFNPYRGRMAEIPPSEKPFPHRAGNLAKHHYAIIWNESGVEVAEKYIWRKGRVW